MAQEDFIPEPLDPDTREALARVWAIHNEPLSWQTAGRADLRKAFEAGWILAERRMTNPFTWTLEDPFPAEQH